LNYQNINKPLLYQKKQSEITLSPEALLTIARTVLGKGIPFRFRAGGFSMSPFIRDGDVITVSPLKNGHISTGDVVAAFHSLNRKVFLHRVVRKIGNLYLLKGDNCPEADGMFPRENIMGKVTKIERSQRKKLFGLGAEKFVIAALSRNRYFISMIFSVRKYMFLMRRKGL